MNLPRSTRRSIVAVTVAVLVTCLLVSPARADSAPADARSASVAALDLGDPVSLTTDLSATLPRSFRDELTGDFLGLGYDQHMRAEGSSLNIYDPPAHGSDLRRSTPLDLATAPNGVTLCDEDCSDEETITTWADTTNASSFLGTCSLCFPVLFGFFHLQTIYLAMADGHLFISGTKGSSVFINGATPDSSEYFNLVYEVPTDGSCASESCARHVVYLPTFFQDCTGNWHDRFISVTAMAAGMSGGNPYLAVGLSDNGLNIYDASLTQTGSFTGMGTGDCSQTVPSALAWDPAGSGTLGLGVFSRERNNFYLTVNAAGAVTGANSWFFEPGDDLVPGPSAVGFGRDASGDLVAAFGQTNGPASGSSSLVLLDPTVTGPDTVATSGTLPGSIVTINPLPRFDGTGGADDYAVFAQAGGDPSTGNGMSLRHDQGGTTITAQTISVDGSGNSSPVVATQDGFRAWYPGYKQGRFAITNTSTETVTVDLQQSPTAGTGCWFAATWPDANPFPDQDQVTIPPGQTTSTYVMGGYTGGQNGLCGATDATGEMRAYLVITPLIPPPNPSANLRVVDLHLGKTTWSVDVNDQVGGGLAVSAARTGPAGAFGAWTITVTGDPAPTALTAPTLVVGHQLTPTDWPEPPVYRFDVSGATFTIGSQVQTQLKPLQVSGSLDGQTWTALGDLVPRTALTLGADGQTLSLGRASFWWENPTGQPQYRYFRVSALGQATANQLNSTAVDVTQLIAPADPSTDVTSANIVPPTGGARPVDSGVDQAPLQVQIQVSGGAVLPATNPLYDQVYYRDVDNDLLTNLFLQGGDPTTFIGVSPYAGAYANNGSLQSIRQATAGPSYDYVSTTSNANQTVTAYVGGVLLFGAPNPSTAVPVQGTTIAPAPSAQSAALGISLQGCSGDYTSSSTCRQAPITATRPALYLGADESGNPQIGVFKSSLATTAAASLPLTQQAGQTPPGRQLASAPLTVASTGLAAVLKDTSAFLSTDSIDTALVTHGVLVVPVLSIPVQIPSG